MKKDIILAGVGGQGILSIAATIGMAALEDNLNLRQAEVHGMSQRGGAVQSHMRLSDTEIMSDLIPEGQANLIISVEPMESLRYLPYLNEGGWLVTSTKTLINIPDYPEEEVLIEQIQKVKNHVAIDANAIAKKVATPKSVNIVMLGAASPFLDIAFEKLENGIRNIFGRKGEKIVDANLAALRAGREAALASRN